MLWEKGRVSKLNLAGAESIILEGSGQGPTWVRRETTQWPLKGPFDIHWSKLFATMDQNF